MRRARKKHQDPDIRKLIAAIPFLLLLVILSTPVGQKLLFSLAFIAALSALLIFGAKIYASIRSKEAERALQISDIDSLTGHSFEYYIASLLEHNGFRTQVTKGSGDAGVDIVAHKGGIKYAIQCKRSSSSISRRAVSDAVAGIAHYRCTRAMVVTNNFFTPGAKSLATSNQCILIDRDTLASWILARQNRANISRKSARWKGNSG